MGNTSPSSGEIASISAKIMISTIILVFFLMLFLFCVHIYFKCYWTSYEDPTIVSWRRREARRARMAAQRRGLDPLALRSMPVVVYNPKDFKDGLECAVCLSEVSQGEKARILPKCNHGFHVDCIDMWFHSHSTCPLCRNPVLPSQNPSTKPNNSGDNGVLLPTIGSSDTSSSDEDGDHDHDDASYGTSAPSMEAANFPTNVLVWGNETRVRPIEGEGTSSSTSAGSASSSAVTRPGDELVIEIPMRMLLEDGLSSPSLPSSTWGGGDEDVKSPAATRLRSLKRLLSRGKRVAPSPRGSNSGDALV
uniref:RING-type E3 ubiquitin transferase n=1 Tax=Opuntia streptacantha TaxID=393608 RepID=A0A7C9DYI6_OPUST